MKPQPGDEQLERPGVRWTGKQQSVDYGKFSHPGECHAETAAFRTPATSCAWWSRPAMLNNQINLEVYSVYDPGVACITVIESFSATVPLGSFSDGHYA